MKVWKITLLLLSSTTLCCNQKDIHVPPDVQHVIVLSGEKSNELWKVIRHYRSPQDSVKLKAAYYLISNLGYQYHVAGKAVEKFDRMITTIDSAIEIHKPDFKRKNDSAKITNPIYDLLEPINSYRRKVIDSMQKIYGNWGTYGFKRVNDLKVINADLLIENIEYAFEAWKLPWSRQLTFSQFCEYILPYKMQDEEPGLWRKELMARFLPLKDLMKDSTDGKEMCLLINKVLKDEFHIEGSYFKYPVSLSFKQLSKLRIGKCSDANHYAMYAMRALGIPVVNDFTPYWANKNKGHDWLNLIYKFPDQTFVGCESNPGLDKINFAGRRYMYRRCAKIFRHTYRGNIRNAIFNDYSGDIPTFFEQNNYIDVTRSYVPVSDIKIPLDTENFTANGDIAYLCVFSDDQWKAVAASVLTGSTAEFKNIGRSIAYLVTTFSNGEYHPVSIT